MIQERKFYGIRCDGCGTMLKDEEQADLFFDIDSIQMVAKESEWQNKGVRWFCPNCVDKGLDNDQKPEEKVSCPNCGSDLVRLLDEGGFMVGVGDELLYGGDRPSIPGEFYRCMRCANYFNK